MVKEINRMCSICGMNILVKVKKGGAYSGGNFFGRIDSNTEYWECNKCYRNQKEIVPIVNERFSKKLEALLKEKFVTLENFDGLFEK